MVYGGGYGFWTPTGNKAANRAHVTAFLRRGRRGRRWPSRARWLLGAMVVTVAIVLAFAIS